MRIEKCVNCPKFAIVVKWFVYTTLSTYKCRFSII